MKSHLRLTISNTEAAITQFKVKDIDNILVNIPIKEENSNIIVPALKEIRNDNNINESNVYTFYKKHLKDFYWLDYYSNKLICKICATHSIHRHDAFVEGTENLKTSNLTRHDKSIEHQSNLNKEKLKQRDSINVIPKIEISKINKSFENFIKSCLFVAHEEIPITKILALRNFLQDLEVDTTDLYRTEYGSRQVLESISSVFERKLIKKLEECDSLSITFDETIDISSKKILIICVRYCTRGDIKEEFYKLIELKSSDAETIYSALKSSLGDKIYKKISSITTDGANVMMGRIKGVSELFKKENKNIISNHCIAHRSNLCTLDMFNFFPEMKRISVFLFEIFAFFKKSSCRIGTLHEKEDENYLDDLSLIKPITVRWLSHSKAINRLIEILIPILETLDEYQNDTTLAVGLLETIKIPKIIMTIHFLADMLDILTILNKTFQNKLMMISNIDGVIKSTINNIKSQYLSENSTYGDKLRNFINMANTNDKYKKYIEINQADINDFGKTVIIPVADFVVSNIRERFPEFTLIKNFSIFDLAIIKETKNLPEDYGNKEFIHLCDFYRSSPFDRPEDYLSQWTDFKQFIKETFKGDISYTNYLLYRDGHILFNKVMEIMNVYLALNSTTVECERYFSRLTFIKNKARSTLSIFYADILLRIKSNENILFDQEFYNNVIEVFEEKERRFLIK
jgi:hypothetical protein